MFSSKPATDTPNTSRTHIPIASPGDIYITVLQTKQKITTELCYEVNSHLLRAVSPVFSTMFAPDSPFLEGAQIQAASVNGGKAYIRFGEDNPHALEILLRIVHFKTSTVPKEAGLNLIAILTVLADKYAVQEALQTWVEKWTSEITAATMGAVGSENWLMVCSHFKLPQL